MENSIELTGIDLNKFIKKVYDLSQPVGMGFLHFEEGGLSDEEVNDIINSDEEDSHLAVMMDYVKGRQCKMTVFKKDGKLFMRDKWFDHSETELQELLTHCNISKAE